MKTQVIKVAYLFQHGHGLGTGFSVLHSFLSLHECLLLIYNQRCSYPLLLNNGWCNSKHVQKNFLAFKLVPGDMKKKNPSIHPSILQVSFRYQCSTFTFPSISNNGTSLGISERALAAKKGFTLTTSTLQNIQENCFL